jgi:uncharacterized membrane protein
VSAVPPTRAAEPPLRPDPLVDLIARLLGAGTIAVVLVVAAGTLLVLLTGVVPVEQVGPALDPGRLVADLLALRPEAVLWVGLLLSIVLPTARVGLALVGFARRGERRLVVISASTLVVLGASVAAALVTR